ncbi:MAG: hypothetical protein CL910_09320 [Deltaproteobacteria bacterium]|nr:hypothetical protein [Deltaproteobacteria bacterium]
MADSGSGKIVAICGPDGVGKSTLVSELQRLLPGGRVSVMYGGKKANHQLWTTPLALWILETMRRIPGVRRLARFYQTVVFQPLEFFENRARWASARREAEQREFVLFDRFVVDRMWRHHVSKAGRSLVKVNPGDRFFYWLYESHFPSPHAYLFLAPTPELMFERAPGEYGSLDHAIAVGLAYDALAESLAARGRRVHRLGFSAEEAPLTLAQRALELVRS